MQSRANQLFLLSVISVLFFTHCNGPAPADNKTTEDTVAAAPVKDSAVMPAIDPAMDPLVVGAKFLKVLADTLGIKFYEVTMKPGDSATWHSHPDHAIYVLEGGQLRISSKDHGMMEMNLKKGMGFANGPVTDAGRNTGKTTVKFLVQDVHRPLNGDLSYMPAYDAAMDPVTVGGKSVKKISDTLNMKMYEYTVKPGEKMPRHAHPDHSIYILEGGSVVVYMPGNAVETLAVKPKMGFINGPIIDSARNIGKTIIRFVETDFYRPR